MSWRDGLSARCKLKVKKFTPARETANERVHYFVNSQFSVMTKSFGSENTLLAGVRNVNLELICKQNEVRRIASRGKQRTAQSIQ
jgi:hypothetical protein